MTGAQRVLQRLQQGPASHLELYRLGVIAHSRIAELRAKGHVIACERDGDLYIYRLLGDGPETDWGEKTLAGVPEKAHGDACNRAITEQPLDPSPASHSPSPQRDAGQIPLWGEPAATNHRVVEGDYPGGHHEGTTSVVHG